MPIPLKVLILEDSPNDIILLLRELRRNNFDVDHRAVSNADDMRTALQDRKWDIILSDYAMGGFDALAALQIRKEFGLDIPFIIISGTVGEDTAVAAMKAGASDFFAKDKLTRLTPAVERELREAEGRRKRGEAEAGFTTVFHASPVGILLSRLVDGQVLDANPRLLDLYGLSREEIMQMQGAELENAVKLKQPDLMNQQLKDTGSANNVEVEYQHRSGRQGYALLSAEIIELNNEPCVLTMVQDISARKEAEQSLERYADRLELLHSIDVAILSADQPKAIAENVLTRLQSSLNFDSAMITSFDLPKQQSTVLAAINPVPEFQPDLDQTISESLRCCAGRRRE